MLPLIVPAALLGFLCCAIVLLCPRVLMIPGLLQPPILAAAGVISVAMMSEQRRRRPAVPPALLLAFAGFALAGAGLAALGASTAFVFLWAALPLGGRLIGWLLLYAAVQKTERLHLASAIICGAAGAVGLALASRSALAPAASVAAGLLAVAGCLPAARRADMAAPISERGRHGIVTVLAVMLVAVGSAGAFARVLAVSQPAAAPLALAAVALGSILGPWIQPRGRRIGNQLGFAALVSAAALAGCIGLERRDGLEWLALVLLAAAAAVLGAALPFLARFYSAVPLGSNILADIPEAERRAPDGGVARAAMFLAGAATTAWLARLTPAWFTGGTAGWFLGALFLGGVAAALFDPRAGPGRKLLTLAVAGVPAALVLLRVV